ncbi:MAG: alanine racemase, partial [Pseudomonadota bacterium]
MLTGTPNTSLKETIARSIGTPAVVIDLDIVERNIARTQALCDAAGIKNRPHIKTHKNGDLARQQIAAGAAGVACQKLGEAETMLDAGIEDILVCYNTIGGARAGQLTPLLRRADVKLAADNPVTLAAYADAASQAERPASVLIECDTGRKRAGVETPAEAVALAVSAHENPHLQFRGLLLYPTGEDWPRDQRFLDDTKAGLRDAGLSPDIVSTGGTPNLKDLGKLQGVTEHRAGTSIYNDRMMMAAGSATFEDCALSVYSTVVSRAAPDRGILDAGSKTLTSDTGGLDGFGLIVEHPEAKIVGFSEEHGNLDLTHTATK